MAPPRSVSRTAPLLVGLLLLLAFLALHTLLLLALPVRSVTLGAPGDAYLAASFYASEGPANAPFRWSGPNSTLLLPPQRADGTLLRLRLHGVTGDQTLRFATAAGPLATVTPTPGWRVYRLLVAAPAPPHAMQLQADLRQPGPDDPRQLGVAVSQVRMEPLPRDASGLSSALARSALLAWALALAWFAFAILQRSIGLLGRWGPVGLLGLLMSGLLLWAWRDPDGLSWLLPLQGGPLALTTLALAGCWLVARGPHRPQPARRRLPPLLGTALVLGLAHLALLAPLPQLWRGIAALVILWTPGWLALRLLLCHERDRAMALVLAVAGALALQVALSMATAALPGGATLWTLLLLANAVSLLCGWALIKERPRPLRPWLPPQAAPWLLVLLLAAGLRLPFLGGAELHDDEASVLLGSAALVQGRSEVLLEQLKGPVQILLPTGPLALTGQLSEQVARLPFAVAGLAVVLGGLALARRLVPLGQHSSLAAARLRGLGALGGSTPSGDLAVLLAGLLLALDGLLIAFSRIVQYQSLVMLMGLCAFWCCWRFARGAPGPQRYLIAAALFSATALLGHYDAIYALPALALLVFVGARRRGWSPAMAARALVAPVLVAAGLLASFYLPFVRDPHFARTLGHLSERTGQQGDGWTVYNNLGSSVELLTFYSTPAQVWLALGLIAALLATLLVRGRRRAGRAAAWPLGIALLLLVLAATALAGPLLSEASGVVPLLLGALLIAAAILAPATPLVTRALLVWFGAGSLAMSFLVAQPRTHIYVAVIPAALLAALALQRLATARLLPLLRPALAGLVLLGASWAALYQESVYLRQSPEYQRVYPAAWLPPLPGGRATLPLDDAARFGFPSRDGWKAIGMLLERSELQGAVAANQSSEVLAWYLPGQERCGVTPDLYLIALSAPNPAIPAGYALAGVVQVAGRDQIAIYQRAPLAGPLQIFPLERFVGPFDERPIPLDRIGRSACPGAQP